MPGYYRLHHSRDCSFFRHNGDCQARLIYCTFRNRPYSCYGRRFQETHRVISQHLDKVGECGCAGKGGHSDTPFLQEPFKSLAVFFRLDSTVSYRRIYLAAEFPNLLGNNSLAISARGRRIFTPFSSDGVMVGKLGSRVVSACVLLHNSV